ncbi:MAG: 2,3,4,5-tetrahydropyridine-2,6-dicarboxylate N-succinyltransferase [Acidobacteria bacterium]|nr:2,3,4,5-tetrahydropyridine-2,6-dicarboxylate N-succinyltransferase [Acidobacteriota bacterium]
MRDLQDRIQKLFLEPPEEGYAEEHFRLFEEFKCRLNSGEVRAAYPEGGSWRVNLWVKQGILVGFRMGVLQDYSIDENFRFFDKDTLPTKRVTIDDGVRIVPGGSSIRDGAHIGRGVTCMPPMYINVGAFVGDDTMIDSHALVGSCAQIGKRVHLSAGSQIGGVLEPVGALPVIVEDDVLVGGNCGIYEGTVVRESAVIGAGTILTRGTPVYDLVRETIYRKEGDQPLEIPPRAVVIPGARTVSRGWGKELGLSLYTPIIVKYRDEKTEGSIRLEDALR